ncbi:MAG: alpha/beta fold hydrolase [Pseudomonadota bacterium]
MRVPIYFSVMGDPVFAWYHAPADGMGTDLAVVLCPPLGAEYAITHRTMRHLADRYAAAGIAALRIDYHGTGDSAGYDEDPQRFAAWLESVKQAVAQLRDISGCHRIGLAGLRMGATFAALVASEIPVELLILWGVCTSGRHYLREMKLLEQSFEASLREPITAPNAIEAAGYVLTEETCQAVRAIDLKTIAPHAQRILLMGRDDLPEDAGLAEAWRARGLAVEQREMTGYAAMMARPHTAVVPQATLDALVAWSRESAGQARELNRSAAFTQHAVLASGSAPAGTAIRESLLRFGEDERLFGVWSEPSAGIDPSRPAVVLINSGAVHHIGVNRIYVLLARALAQAGFGCLRMDTAGMGDSVADDPADENQAYGRTVAADIHAALRILQARTGARAFVIGGLCSGAHGVFHAGLELSDEPIAECLMINPLTFYWQPGMSLDEDAVAKDIQRLKKYRRSLLQWEKWRKVLRGDVNFGTFFATVGKTLRSRLFRRSASETPAASRRNLAGDLARLAANGRRLTFVLADRDPGHDLLMLGAKKQVAALRANGSMRIYSIENANHTFVIRRARQAFIRTVVEHALLQYRNPAGE